MGYVICFEKRHFQQLYNEIFLQKTRGKHGISLFLHKSENIESKANDSNDNKNDANVYNLSADNFNTIVPTTAESSNVLLQTAFAKITNERGGHFEKVRS